MFLRLSFTLVYLTALSATDSISTECNDYTFDKCEFNSDAVIETLSASQPDDCQFYCDVLYNNTCTFFIHDNQQHTCTLLTEELETYINTCRKIGGPLIPSIYDCKRLQDPCKVLFCFKSME